MFEGQEEAGVWVWNAEGEGEWRPMRVARWAGTSPRDGEERLGFYSRGSGSYRRD